MTLQQLEALRDELNKLMLSASNTDLQRVGQLLTQAKIALIQLDAFVPVAGKADPNILVAARDILETGAYYSVRIEDIPSFERYIAQLNTYYHDLAKELPPSTQMNALIGVNLLRLLSKNQLSDFHTVLETIDPDQIQSNAYIKQAVDLEQFLMEGSYNKVYNARSNIEGKEFMFFYDSLMVTIRHEIANCSEKAYDWLPIKDACTLLFLPNTQELLQFSSARGWSFESAGEKVFFKTSNKAEVEIPQEQIITRTLGYARELERIV